MNLDSIYLISLFSLLLRLFFLSLISFEMVLPVFRNPILRLRWKSDFRTELSRSLVMAGSFAFAILFLIVLDVFSSESPLWLVVNLMLDCLILISVLVLLFIPKTYGLSERGIYLNGPVIPWGEIEVVERKGDMLVLKRKEWWKEEKRLLLPDDPEIKTKVMKEIRERVALRDE